jgi:hypothetical protein
VFLRGALLAVILAVGLVGLFRHRTRLDNALMWFIAACLLMVPLLTADFDYRYVLPAVPIACVSAALAARPVRPQQSGESDSTGTDERTDVIPAETG